MKGSELGDKIVEKYELGKEHGRAEQYHLTLEKLKGLWSDLDIPNTLGDRGPYFTRDEIQDMIKKWFPDAIDSIQNEKTE